MLDLAVWKTHAPLVADLVTDNSSNTLAMPGLGVVLLHP